MTIIRFKALKDWFQGKAKEESIRENTLGAYYDSQAIDPQWGLNANAAASSQFIPQLNAYQNRLSQQQMAYHQSMMNASAAAFRAPSREESYRSKHISNLMKLGYQYFLWCDHHDFEEHEEWCFENCDEPTVPHCDVWQNTSYPRAFKSKTDCVLFKLHFDATAISPDSDSEGGTND